MKNRTKARKQGNSIVVTIPKSFSIAPGTQYIIEKRHNGELILKPEKDKPKNLEELFKEWNGQYEQSRDLDDWDCMF